MSSSKFVEVTAFSKCRKLCSVPGCGMRGVRMFTFPKDTNLREEWRSVCKIDRHISGTMYVCHRHFAFSDFYKTPKGVTRIHKDRKPSIFLPASTPVKVVKHKRRCVVTGCGSHGKMDDVVFHSFPRDKHRRMHWRLLCRLEKAPSRNTLICNQHFTPSDFIQKGMDRVLKRSAKPSQNMPDRDDLYEIEDELYHSSLSSSRTVEQAEESFIGYDIVSSRLETEDYLKPLLKNHCICCGTLVILRKQSSSSEEITSVQLLDNDNVAVNSNSHRSLKEFFASFKDSSFSENVTQRDLLSHKSIGSQTSGFSVLSMIRFDSQIKSLLGISFSVLETLTELAVELSNRKVNTDFPMRERIALTLCKLRLNMKFSCLCILFGVDRRLCSSYFGQTLRLLAQILKCAINWPSKEEVRINMPKYFEKYPDTRVILDFTEIPVDSPQCQKCRLWSYSHYKTKFTIKVLIGIAPSGLISFISKVHEGKVPNKNIFEDSDLVSKNLLDPFTDAVMVDKGFQIDEVCGEKYIRTYSPPFILGLQPLEHPPEASIASAKVHVERAIQKMKVFEILQSKLSWSMVPFADDIITVIAGLVNLSLPTSTGL